LLDRALAVAGGERPPEDWTPELNLGLRACIPAAYVPEEEIRLNLHARLARARSVREIEGLDAEIEDRFGTPPEGVSSLFALARLAQACRLLGIAKSTQAYRLSP
jgi:transcription-repair coupling factor (superfamily II helicase)